MLDNKDIENLKENFVTKNEFESLLEIVATKEDLKNFATKDMVNEVLTGQDKIMEKLDLLLE